MRPKTKYAVIHRHRNEYPISVMCKFFEVSRSGYYDFVKRLGNPEKDADLAEKIRLCQESSDKTYGYRRVWLWLERRNIKRNPKTVLRVMKKYGLLSEIRRCRKWLNLGMQMESPSRDLFGYEVLQVSETPLSSHTRSYFVCLLFSFQGMEIYSSVSFLFYLA